MKLFRYLSNSLIVFGYVVAALFAGTLAGALVAVRDGGNPAVVTGFMLASAAAGVAFGVRRCMNRAPKA